MPNVRCVPQNRGTRTVVSLDAAFAHVSARARMSVLLCVCLCVSVFFCDPSSSRAPLFWRRLCVYVCDCAGVCVVVCVIFGVAHHLSMAILLILAALLCIGMCMTV